MKTIARMLGVLLLAVAAPLAQAQASAPRTETLAADSARATAGGVTFTAPREWTVEHRGALVLMRPPEGDATLAFADAPGPDAQAAVAAAWQAFAPGPVRPLRVATPAAPLNGWEELQNFTYETSPNERRTVFAQARRAGDKWLAVIIDASQATLEKRGSQFGLATQSLRPAGYQRESFAGRKAHPLDAARVAQIKGFVEDAMRRIGVPGVGLALIDGGEIVYAGGLGVKALGKSDPVDGDTLFLAASNTKALTSLLLARMVDANKLRWDQPVGEVFPKFKLGDPATTKSTLVKHLVCACTGMPRQDLEWLFEFKRASAATTLQTLGTMQPTSRFGDLFQYSNPMVSAAGYVGASLAHPGMELGAAYDKAMSELIFRPLGMERTTFDFAKVQRTNHARPHGPDVDGVMRGHVIDIAYSIVPVRPAGGVWTSARDLAKYVRMELARGRLPDGRRLVSEEALLARRVPQVAVSEDIDYGMGLFVDRRWGVTMLRHGGDMPGYHSDMMWFPDHGVGAVILTNADRGHAIRGPLLRRLAEVMFDGKPEAQAQVEAAAKTFEAATAKARERLVIPADPAVIGALASRYANPQLGTVDILRGGKEAMLDAGEWKSTLATRRNDDGSVSLVTTTPTLVGFEFVVAERDGKRALVVRQAQHEYVFRAVGD